MDRIPFKVFLPPALALLLFTSLAARNLALPGLHPDEAQEAGIQAQQFLAAQPVTAFRGAVVSLAGRQFPLMVQDYIGALNVLLAVPFLAGLGGSVFALRFMAVCLGLVTVALVYALARQLAGRRAAAMAVALLTVQPSFVFWNRQGVFVTSIAATLGVAALWALAAWLRRPGRRHRLALTGLLAGLGVYAKLLFLWLLGGVLLTAALCLLMRLLVRPANRPPAALQHSPSSQSAFHVASRPVRNGLRITDYALRFTLPFLFALLPLGLYNLQTGGTLAAIAGNLTTSFYGVNNLDTARNLATRLDQAQAVLAGRDHLWYLGGSFGNPLAEWLLLAALAVIAARALARRPGAGLPLALAAALALAFLQSIFTVSGLFPTHFALLIPYSPLLIGLAADGLLRELKGTSQSDSSPGSASPASSTLAGAAAAALALALAGSAARDVWVNIQYHRALPQTGGLNAHSDAVYRLAAYLDQAGRPAVALDWGIAPGVDFLTEGRVKPVEVFGYSLEPDAEFEGRLAAGLATPGALYLLHWPQETIFPRQEAFEAALRARGLQAVWLQTFSRRDGAPIFDVLQIE